MFGSEVWVALPRGGGAQKGGQRQQFRGQRGGQQFKVQRGGQQFKGQRGGQRKNLNKQRNNMPAQQQMRVGYLTA